MNDADGARGKDGEPRDIGWHPKMPMSGSDAVNPASSVAKS